MSKKELNILLAPSSLRVDGTIRLLITDRFPDAFVEGDDDMSGYYGCTMTAPMLNEHFPEWDGFEGDKRGDHFINDIIFINRNQPFVPATMRHEVEHVVMFEIDHCNNSRAIMLSDVFVQEVTIRTNDFYIKQIDQIVDAHKL